MLCPGSLTLTIVANDDCPQKSRVKTLRWQPQVFLHNDTITELNLAENHIGEGGSAALGRALDAKWNPSRLHCAVRGPLLLHVSEFLLWFTDL